MLHLVPAVIIASAAFFGYNDHELKSNLEEMVPNTRIA